MNNRLELLEQNLARFLEWIRAADSKIPPILAIDTSMLAVFGALVPKPSYWNLWPAILSVFTVIPLLISLVFLALSSFPHIRGPKDSLLYFECVKKRDPETYLKEVLSADDQRLLSDFAAQCCRNAEIASTKFRHSRIAMVALYSSILPWLVLIYILYKGR